MSISSFWATVAVISRNSGSPLLWQRSFIRMVPAIICLALCSAVHAVSPPPDGAYPNGKTAEGDSALANATTGGGNNYHATGIQSCKPGVGRRTAGETNRSTDSRITESDCSS